MDLEKVRKALCNHIDIAERFIAEYKVRSKQNAERPPTIHKKGSTVELLTRAQTDAKAYQFLNAYTKALIEEASSQKEGVGKTKARDLLTNVFRWTGEEGGLERNKFFAEFRSRHFPEPKEYQAELDAYKARKELKKQNAAKQKSSV